MFFNMEASQVCRNINFSHDTSLPQSPILIALTVLLLALMKILLKIDRDLVIIISVIMTQTTFIEQAKQRIQRSPHNLRTEFPTGLLS